MATACEEFLLSNNRRKLLQIDREDTKTKQDVNDIDSISSSIIYGSEQHQYYHLLQIENEITNILINNKDLNNASQDDTDKIKSLLNEANGIINKYTENKKNKSLNESDIDSEEESEIESGGESEIDILSFRHKLRTLFLSP